MSRSMNLKFLYKIDLNEFIVTKVRSGGQS